MEFENIFNKAKDSIIIFGTTPLIPYLEKSALFFSDLLKLNEDLNVWILCENNNDLFNRSILFSNKDEKNGYSYSVLKSHRNRIFSEQSSAGIISEIKSLLKDNIENTEILKRISVKQYNLPMTINTIKIDDEIYYSLVTNNVPNVKSYNLLKNDSNEYQEINNFLLFVLDNNKGKKYLSNPFDELIGAFDRDKHRRGILPRSCFYTTDYARYVVWVIVYNRNGEILLHKRSQKTKDNRLLWDKSIGGHVDNNDSSTAITAKRELVEEMYLPEAEFSSYIMADIGEIIDFGEWNPKKRPEACFENEFNYLGESDWIMFRATDTKGLPLTNIRASQRIISNDKGENTMKKTVFISDIYFMIAPQNQLDTIDEVRISLKAAEEKGVASDHKILTFAELQSWIRDEEIKGKERKVFTDDLLYLCDEHGEILETFGEFVKDNF